MTTTAEQAKTDKAEALKARNADMNAREKKLNEGKNGKGTRTFLGMTRGRNPQEIEFENWDVEQPTTLLDSLAEGIDLMEQRGFKGENGEREIVRRILIGDNDILYTEASDPVAGFVEASWSEDIKKGFRAVVRNYSTNLGMSIEDAANIIKPAYLASQAKK